MSFKIQRRLLIALVSLPVATFLALGCSGTTAATSTNSNAVTAPAFVVGTDAPLPNVASFSVQIQSINAIDATGTSVPLISGTPTVDFARFNGLQTLLDMNDVPVGTYNSVSITLGPATIG